MDDSSQRRLGQVHPALRRKITTVIESLAAVGMDVRVVQGLRTYAQQDALYAQGRSKSGRKVTNARGGFSNHNFGLAADLCPFTNGQPDWNDANGFSAIGRAALREGLEWGGNWRFVDKPHCQLRGMSIKECRSLYSKGGLDLVWMRMNALMGGAMPAENVPAKNDLIEEGDIGPEVRALQASLLQLKFIEKHQVDSRFGPVTKNAVRRFQKSRGLAADGIVGNRTRKELDSALLKLRPLGDKTSAAAPAVTQPGEVKAENPDAAGTRQPPAAAESSENAARTPSETGEPPPTDKGVIESLGGYTTALQERITPAVEQAENIEATANTVRRGKDSVKSLVNTVTHFLFQPFWAVFAFVEQLPWWMWLTVVALAGITFLVYHHRQFVMGKLRESGLV